MLFEHIILMIFFIFLNLNTTILFTIYTLFLFKHNINSSSNKKQKSSDEPNGKKQILNIEKEKVIKRKNNIEPSVPDDIPKFPIKVEKNFGEGTLG